MSRTPWWWSRPVLGLLLIVLTACGSATSSPTMAPGSGSSGAPMTNAGSGPAGPMSVQGQQGSAPRAGEVDDNRDFQAYLTYLQSYQDSAVHRVNVKDRMVLTVVNQQQQPVLDARVRVFADEEQVFVGRTYAGGQTIMFPGTFPSAKQSVRVLVEKGQSSTQTLLTLDSGTLTKTVVLSDSIALPARPRLDVMFLLDATGSMGDEIGRLQTTISSIASRINDLTPAPEVRYGLVSYRDRGDAYVTKHYDFTASLGVFQKQLQGVQADGGGDTPESLNEGLHVAIADNQWADDAVRIVFLVADAPPHLDYPNDYDYVTEAQHAVAGGIKIYPIAASNSDAQAEYIFRQLAQQTLGHFLFLTYQPGQNAGAPGDSTTHHVDPSQFTVERLDDLVVQVVERELNLAQGKAQGEAHVAKK